MIVLTSNSDSTYKAQSWLVALIASLWQIIALYQGNNLPLPGTKRYVGSFFYKSTTLLFTLHSSPNRLKPR